MLTKQLERENEGKRTNDDLLRRPYSRLHARTDLSDNFVNYLFLREGWGNVNSVVYCGGLIRLHCTMYSLLRQPFDSVETFQ